MGNPADRLRWLKILEIDEGASPEALHRAYKKQAMLWHPDRFLAGSELHCEAQSRIILIGEAYRGLLESGTGNPQKRNDGSWKLIASILLILVFLGFGIISTILRFSKDKQATNPKIQERLPSPPPLASPIPNQVSTESSQPLVVPAPAIVIMSSNLQDQRLGPPITLQEITNFVINAESVTKRIKESHANISIIYSESQEINCGSQVFTRAKTSGFGYIVYIYPTQAHFLDGIHTAEEIEKVVKADLIDYSRLLTPAQHEPAK